MAVVATLRVAPVKGLATVTRDRIWIDADGVAEDRRVFLLDDRGAVITIRSHPQLVAVTPDLDLQRGVLSVTLGDGAVASSHLAEAAEPVEAHLFGRQRPGRVLHGDVARALSAAAGEQVRVIVADRTGVGWDDGPVSIIGRSSAAVIGAPDRARYRMLVELDETSPYEEDTWVGYDVELGQARVHVTHQLQRCVVVTRSPATGEKDWDGLHALAQARGRDQLCLGVIAEVSVPGQVSVGATVGVAAGRGEAHR